VCIPVGESESESVQATSIPFRPRPCTTEIFADTPDTTTQVSVNQYEVDHHIMIEIRIMIMIMIR